MRETAPLFVVSGGVVMPVRLEPEARFINAHYARAVV